MCVGCGIVAHDSPPEFSYTERFPACRQCRKRRSRMNSVWDRVSRMRQHQLRLQQGLGTGGDYHFGERCPNCNRTIDQDNRTVEPRNCLGCSIGKMCIRCGVHTSDNAVHPICQPCRRRQRRAREREEGNSNVIVHSGTSSSSSSSSSNQPQPKRHAAATAACSGIAAALQQQQHRFE